MSILVLPAMYGLAIAVLVIPAQIIFWEFSVVSKKGAAAWLHFPVRMGLFSLILHCIAPALWLLLFGLSIFLSSELSGGTPGLNCSLAGVSRLYPSGSPAPSQPPREISFFSQCSSSEVELVGYASATAATKCCVPALRGRFTCDGYSLVPDIVRQAEILFDNETRSSYASCCPELFAGVIPAGFATMIVGSVIGVLVNVLLNGLPLFVRFCTEACNPAPTPVEHLAHDDGAAPATEMTVVTAQDVTPAKLREQGHERTLEHDSKVVELFEHDEAHPPTPSAERSGTAEETEKALPAEQKAGGCEPNKGDAVAAGVLDNFVSEHPEVTAAVMQFPVRTVVEGNRDRTACCLSRNLTTFVVGKEMNVELYRLSDIVERKTLCDLEKVVKLVESPAEVETELQFNCCCGGSTEQPKRVPVLCGVCFSADDSELLCVSDDVSRLFVVCVASQTVTVCRLAPEPLWIESGSCTVCVSSDGLTAVVLSDAGLSHCRRQSQEAPFVLHRHFVRLFGLTVCMFAPSGGARLLLCVHSDMLDIDLNSDSDEQLMPLCDVSGRPKPTAERGCIALSIDGCMLALGGVGGLQLRDQKSGSSLYCNEQVMDSLSLVFTPCGRFLVEYNGSDCRFWSVSEERSLTLHSCVALDSLERSVIPSSIHVVDGTMSTMVLINVLERHHLYYPGVRVQLFDLGGDLQRFRDDTVMAHNRFVADLFDISDLTMLKFAVGVLAGICLALMSAASVRRDTELNNWACYEAFVITLVNGPALANFVDLASTAAMSRGLPTNEFVSVGKVF